MTSANTFPQRWTKIDSLQRPDHWYLSEHDQCFYLGEYTARAGFRFSPTNDLIINFKKSMDVRNRPEWRYKEQAIRTTANAFRSAMGIGDISQLTFIPIPPSKARTDEMYDDRLVRMLRQVRPSPPLDIREVVFQQTSREPVHLADERPDPEEIAATYSIDGTLLAPIPKAIAIVDDVLTTGAHFKAVEWILNSCFPGIVTFGLFIARRVPNSDEIPD